MNEPTLTEDVKTDRPSRKPNRRKRFALRFSVLVVAVAALGAAYWFTRPPELVWWRSSKLDNTGRRVHVLVPAGWVPESKRISSYSARYEIQEVDFHPVDRRPAWLKSIIRYNADSRNEQIVMILRSSEFGRGFLQVGREKALVSHRIKRSHRMVISRDRALTALVQITTVLHRGHLISQSQICNSLKIE